MHVIIRSKYYSSVDICRFLQTSGQELPLFYCCALVVKGTPHRWPATLGIVGILFSKAIPHNSKCRYGERGAADAKPKAQIILDAAKVSAASGGNSEPKQGQRSQSVRGFCPRSTMRVPQPDIIEHFGNADAVPQLPERCLSRKAGIVRCCPKFSGSWAHNVRPYGPCQAECSFTLWTVCLSDCIFLHFYAVKYTSIKIIT